MLCDVELIDSIISDLKLSKAAGLDGWTSEHLEFCHLALAQVLTKLFHIMLKCDKFPEIVGNSYIVPIPGLSCSHAIYSVRKVVHHYINGGSTVNMCTIDLSKAFDKMNHSALFLKLIKKKFQ